MAKKQRNHRSAKDKAALIHQHLIEKVPVGDLCEKHSIAPTQFYQWQRALFENAELALARKQRGESPEVKRIRELEAKLARKNEVLSEVMEEFIQLKKQFGGA